MLLPVGRVRMGRNGRQVRCVASTVVEHPGTLQIAPVLLLHSGIVEKANHPHAVPVDVQVSSEDRVCLHLTKMLNQPPTPSFDDLENMDTDGEGRSVIEKHNWQLKNCASLFWSIRRENRKAQCNCEVAKVVCSSVLALGFGESDMLRTMKPEIDSCHLSLPLITNTKSIAVGDELVCYWPEKPQIENRPHPKAKAKSWVDQQKRSS